MSTVGLAGEWLRARGIRPVSNDATSIVRQAMTSRQAFMSGPGFHTTSDFPVILGDSMQKSLANLFRAADVGVSRSWAPAPCRTSAPRPSASCRPSPS